jgi:hypothetical protein
MLLEDRKNSCWKKEESAIGSQNGTTLEDRIMSIGRQDEVLFEEIMECYWKTEWGSIGKRN